MEDSGTLNSPAQPGTAISSKGRERVTQILDAAYQVLVQDGHADFSLRNVAKQTGIHLRNLQYYFPTRDGLIEALCDHIAEDYGNRLAVHLEDCSDDPLTRFEAAMDYYLDEVSQPETRRMCLNQWALLSAMDAYRGHKLREYYAGRFSGRFRPLLHALNPALSLSQVEVRSKIIAAMVEGMLIMLDMDQSSRAEVKRVIAECKRQALRIATDA